MENTEQSKKVYLTYNRLQRGDIVEYDTGAEAEDGATQPSITGTITDILTPTQIVITPVSGVPMTVSAEWCTRYYNCVECNDTGEVLVERAHQAYTPEKGTYIEDDKFEKCSFCKQ